MPGHRTLMGPNDLVDRTAETLRAIVVPFPMRLYKRIGSESDRMSSSNNLINLAPHFLVVQVMHFHMPWVPITDKPLAIGWVPVSPSHVYHLLPILRFVEKWLLTTTVSISCKL